MCNPLGKSGGSAIQQVMIIAFGSLSASTPYLGAILLVVVLMWMGAARSLNVQVRHPCRRCVWSSGPCVRKHLLDSCQCLSNSRHLAVAVQHMRLSIGFTLLDLEHIIQEQLRSAMLLIRLYKGVLRVAMPELSPACALTLLCAVQFTELQQKEQLAKLAMARTDLATAPSTRKFKFVSNVNEQVSLFRANTHGPFQKQSNSRLLSSREHLV